MSKNLAYIIGILLTMLIGMLLYMNLCSECLTKESRPELIQEAETNNISATTPLPFAIQYDELDLKVNENFNFDTSSSELKLPISFTIDRALAELKDYLDRQPSKMVTITGLYLNDETNTSAFPNLGLARAHAIKNYLVAKGLASTQTQTLDSLVNELAVEETMLLGTATFKITAKAENLEEQLNDLRSEILSEPLLLYFQTGEASIMLADSQREKIAKIVSYLDQMEEAKCLVIGHTDDTGIKETNVKLGLQRAEFVKTYLTQNGIVAEKIEVSSKGPDEPIAPNDTEEGRAKNRRVEITLN